MWDFRGLAGLVHFQHPVLRSVYAAVLKRANLRRWSRRAMKKKLRMRKKIPRGRQKQEADKGKAGEKRKEGDKSKEGEKKEEPSRSRLI